MVPLSFTASSASAAMWLDRRSIYLMRGPSRDEREHSIPALEELRYSVTSRTLRDEKRRIS
jgi:alkylated DNA repair dioxygenase AlkB